MKYKPMTMIAVLSFTMLLSQVGCGTQAQTSATANNSGSSATTTSTSSTSDTSSGTTGSNSSQSSTSTTDKSSTSSGSGSSSNTSTNTSSSSTSSSSAPSGSSSNSQSSAQTNTTGQVTLPKDWEMESKMYPVEGTIVSLDKTSDTLHAIKIKVSKNIKNASTSMDSPNEPFALGSTAEIQFDEALADQGNLNLQVGDVVVINTGQYSFLPKTNAMVWASKFQCVSVQKDGKFYNNKGQAVSVE